MAVDWNKYFAFLYRNSEALRQSWKEDSYCWISRGQSIQSAAADTTTTCRGYVPRSYLRQWSFDGRRVWALYTVTGTVKQFGLADLCVEEDFYRVAGPGGPHNRVELMFGVGLRATPVAPLKRCRGCWLAGADVINAVAGRLPAAPELSLWPD